MNKEEKLLQYLLLYITVLRIDKQLIRFWIIEQSSSSVRVIKQITDQKATFVRDGKGSLLNKAECKALKQGWFIHGVHSGVCGKTLIENQWCTWAQRSWEDEKRINSVLATSYHRDAPTDTPPLSCGLNWYKI